MKKTVKIIITVLLLVGVFFRLWRLNLVPTSLFGDEIDVGLQASSILHTGKDYMGNPFPVMFRSFSEYRYPVQLYLSVPFVKFFGLNEIGVRAASVLMGFISLIFIYFLSREIFGKRVAVISVLLMLFSPWHFNFSRQANDAGILLPFVIGGTYFFLKGLKSYRHFLVAAVFFALSFYSYAIAVLFVPLFVGLLALLYKKEMLGLKFKKLALAGLLGFVILLPILRLTLEGVSSRRFSDISVVRDERVMSDVVGKRRWSDSYLTRIFYNSRTVSLDFIADNYFKSFSSTFLFTKGDLNMRQSVEGFGVLYIFDVVLLVLGGYLFLFRATRGKNKKEYLLFMGWLALAPLPSALTEGGGDHASRLIVMLPPLIVISAVGLNSLIGSMRNLERKAVVSIFLLIILVSLVRFLHRYFVIWPNDSWRYWQTGFKETLTFVNGIDGNFERVYFNNTYEPMLPRFLFYYNYDLEKFQEQFEGDVHIKDLDEGIDGFRLSGKYYFGDLKKPLEAWANKKYLVVASAEKDATNPAIFGNSNLKLLKIVYSPTELPIFYVYTAN